VFPRVMVSSTDCQQYSTLSENIYRLLPLRLYGTYVGMVHGTNEKIQMNNYVERITYYIQTMKNFCAS
jgi:carboxypeptidase PM20D1